MVNLVRFRERSLDGSGSGWDAYTRYSESDMPLLKRVGGRVLWAGHVEGAALGDLGGSRWDWVVVVRYPSRAAFLSMMTSPEYALANRDPRERGGRSRHLGGESVLLEVHASVTTGFRALI